MMAVNNYDIELNDIRFDLDQKSRDNAESIRDSLEKIQLILNDIDSRLKALE